ncbi:MAG: single-stranded-DNA-specific exonuclease RecJ [Clostridiales bacterium]|nr:single-stranded-DNA-specific exonuclease RecJ [Clostridiales bacterium]
MNYKKWVVAQTDKELAATIAEQHNLDPLEALLLVSRGISTDEDITDFFAQDSVLSNPFDILDMDKAVDRIQYAIDEFERIAVYGDYDADGVTATAVLYSYLKEKGADVIYRIPDREDDGYGLNKEAIDELKAEGVKLIVTVDNGISAVEEAKYCRENDIELIVTDHHVAGDILPECVAVVNPHREDCTSEFKDFAGVGVAFKLICAIEGDDEELFEKFADLVAIGTIADIVSLLGENRIIVKKGLEILNKSQRAGVKALKQILGLEGKALSSTTVAFMLAPRINAAGRMGSAERALKLLITDNEDEALDIAQILHEDNAKRQATEQNIVNEIDKKLSENPSIEYDRVMVVDGENWPSGVIGIVASRLVEKYGRPAIVISRSENGEAKGSCRSIDGFSLYDALSSCSDILQRYGGHTLAAGLGLKNENIDKFRIAINDYAKKMEMPFPSLKLDCKLNPAYVNNDILQILSRLEPFGQNNPQPVFGLYGMTLKEIVPLSNGKHLRLVLSKGGNSVTALKFSTSADTFPYVVGDKVDLAVCISPNEFKGEIQVSVRIKDLKMSEEDESECLNSIRLFEKYKRAEEFSEEELNQIVPNRDVIAVIYKFIRANAGWKYPIKMLCYRIGDEKCTLCKVAVALDVMFELGLLEERDNVISLPENVERVNLENSKILSRFSKKEV